MDYARAAFANFRLGFSENLSSADRIGRLIIARELDGPWDLGPGHLVVKHADPRILIGEELARLIAAGDCHPGVKMYTTSTCTVAFDGDPAALLLVEELTGCKLEIHARDRKLIYVLTEYDMACDGYLAEWPD